MKTGPHGVRRDGEQRFIVLIVTETRAICKTRTKNRPFSTRDRSEAGGDRRRDYVLAFYLHL
jgi:hypothetical protein